MNAPGSSSRGSLALLLGAVLLPVPWLGLSLGGFHGDPLLVAVLTGVAILGAAFLLSWAAELLQMDVSQAFALAVLALIAVLPEYAVDAVFAIAQRAVTPRGLQVPKELATIVPAGTDTAVVAEAAASVERV